jgi:phosphoribosyl-AMP cyclohydrolase
MDLDFAKGEGLLPVIVQEARSGLVLMLGFMNEEAYRRTVETGIATFYSRSRKSLWVKGESSGHRMLVNDIRTDCDQDALLLQVEALGPGVCHNGYAGCFYRRLEDGVWIEAETRTYDPAVVYGGTV